jgi:hypothetical protein
VKLEPPAAEPAPEPVAAVAESTASTEAAAPESEGPSRPPLLFVERGGRSHARDEDEDEDEDDRENDELRRKIALAHDVHRQATAAQNQDDEEEEREEKLSEPVLLWPGPREPAPAAPAAPAAAAASAGAEHERPPSFVFLDPNHVAALPPRLRHLAEEFWRLTARWRTLPKNIRYGSPAAAAVLVLALVWWRVARGHEEGGPNYVTESPPAGLADTSARRTTPPRAGTPRTRPTTPRTTPAAEGTTPPTNPAPRDTGARRPPPGPTTAAVEPAHLFIAASPWGVLYVDDRQIGNTPQADVKVPPGTHSIRITRDGYLPYETIIAIEAGESLRLTDIVLQEKPQ